MREGKSKYQPRQASRGNVISLSFRCFSVGQTSYVSNEQNGNGKLTQSTPLKFIIGSLQEVHGRRSAEVLLLETPGDSVIVCEKVQ